MMFAEDVRCLKARERRKEPEKRKRKRGRRLRGKTEEGTWQPGMLGFSEDWRLRLGAVDLAPVKLEKKYRRSPHRQLKSYARIYNRASIKYDVPTYDERSHRDPPRILRLFLMKVTELPTDLRSPSINKSFAQLTWQSVCERERESHFDILIS